MNTILEIILDYSNSMGRFTHNGVNYLLPDGSTRMELAKKALIDDIIPALDYSGKIGIRIFYSNSEKVVINNVFEGEFSKEIVIEKIRDLSDPDNTGGTPISAALQHSIDYLKNYPNSDRKIVLVTDGEETDGGNFIVTAKSGFNDHGIDYSLFIVGIGQSPETASKCKTLSESTNGGYVNLETKRYNKVALSNVLRPLAFTAISSTISNIHNTNEKTLNSSENVEKEKFDNISNFKNEITEVLKNHTLSIELLNKQLVNLAKDIQTVVDIAEFQKQQSCEVGEGLKKIKNNFELYLEKIDQSNQKTFIQHELSLKNILSDIQRIIYENQKVQNEDTLSIINKIRTSIDQSNTSLNSSVMQSFDRLENKIESIDIRINKMYDEMALAFNEIKLINNKKFDLINRFSKELKFWKGLFVLCLVVLLCYNIFFLLLEAEFNR